MDYETRTIDVKTAGLELRARDKGLPSIVGYAAVFNVDSDNLGGYKEHIKPGAFTRTLQHRGHGEGADPIKSFHNHNQDIVLGSTQATPATLRLEQDDNGLWSETSPPDNEWGRPIVQAIERGDIDGMSIGFRVPQDGAVWAMADDGVERREVSQIILAEVSTVSGWPAFPQTTTELRSLMAAALEVDPEEVPDTTDPAEFVAWSVEAAKRKFEKQAILIETPPTALLEARSRLAGLAARYGLPLAPEPTARESTREETTQEEQDVAPPEGGSIEDIV
jgi:HK97 family phage prohead protease